MPVFSIRPGGLSVHVWPQCAHVKAFQRGAASERTKRLPSDKRSALVERRSSSMPPQPLPDRTASMQKELDGLVFNIPTHVPRAHAKDHAKDHFAGGMGELQATSTDLQSMEGMNERSVSFDPVYGTQHEGKVAEDHFKDGMNLANQADLTTRLDKPKDTMTMESINDRAVTFDIVYGSQHNEKDTADHFGMGMNLAAMEAEAILADPDATPRSKHQAILDHKAHVAAEARERVARELAALNTPEAVHTEHSQDHFAANGMGLDADKSVHHYHHHFDVVDHLAMQVEPPPSPTKQVVHNPAIVAAAQKRYKAPQAVSVASLPDFADAGLPSSPGYLAASRTPERVLERKGPPGSDRIRAMLRPHWLFFLSRSLAPLFHVAVSLSRARSAVCLFSRPEGAAICRQPVGFRCDAQCASRMRDAHALGTKDLYARNSRP